MPTAIAARNFLNTSPPTNLSANIDNQLTTTSIPVNSTAGYPPVPFTGCLERNTSNQEFVLVTNVPDANHFTVVRGYDGTPAVAHLAPATFEHCTGAIDFREANQHHTDTSRDDHGQYMLASGVRHDLSARHLVGTSLLAGTPHASAPGDAGAVGGSSAVAAADHIHARESYFSLLAGIVPVGTIFMFGGPTSTSLPMQYDGSGVCVSGFLYLQGQQISRSTYPLLFGLYSTTYGSGNGSSTFNLPNFQGRSPIGVGPSGQGNNYTLGLQWGEESHVLGLSEIPSHYHPVNDPTHYHNNVHATGISDGWIGARWTSSGEGLSSASISDRATFVTPAGVITGYSSTGITTQNQGGGGGHNTVHPVLGINFIVRAG